MTAAATPSSPPFILIKPTELEVYDFLDTLLNQLHLNQEFFRVPLVLILCAVFVLLTLVCLSQVDSLDRRLQSRSERKRKEAQEKAIAAWKEKERVNRWAKEVELSKRVLRERKSETELKVEDI